MKKELKARLSNPNIVNQIPDEIKVRAFDQLFKKMRADLLRKEQKGPSKDYALSAWEAATELLAQGLGVEASELNVED